MTRHGKNCTAGAVYTYHEKKKDTAASGYGTQAVRLGKDAIKDFDCCCLSLQPCRDPVVTLDGYLYEKQAILEYILHQKTEIARKMKAYEKQKRAQMSDSQMESSSEEREKVEKFKKRESSIVSKPINPFTAGTSRDSEVQNGSAGPTASSSASSSTAASSSVLPSFWIPSLTPEAKASVLKKPSNRVSQWGCLAKENLIGGAVHGRVCLSFAGGQPNCRPGCLMASRARVPSVHRALLSLSLSQVKTVLCPMSGRPLKMNDLITVRFTPLDPSLDRVALLTRQDRYVCAVTKDTLGNSVPCAVLRPSGAVVTMECVERLIRKDMTDPVTGDKLTDKDIIPLQRGGTGFSGSGVELKAKEARPVMQV